MNRLNMGQMAAACLLGSLLTVSHAAEPAVGKMSAPASSASASAVKRTSGIAVGAQVKGGMKAGTVLKSPGDSQYPTGTIPVPKPPKDEGLEATGAINAKSVQP